MKLAVLQSNYIPWKGYFDLMAAVDIFVLYDRVQYTKNDWRNRNRIIAQGKPTWLTIPVRRERLSQSIDETRTVDSRWARKHWATLQQSYAGAACFEQYQERIRATYDAASDEPFLAKINRHFIDLVREMLQIPTQIVDSSDLDLIGERTQRLVSICQQLQATTYVSGPAARSYLEKDPFTQAGVEVEWFEYGPYTEYPQGTEEFDHQVSVLDLLLNTGSEAPRFFRRGSQRA